MKIAISSASENLNGNIAETFGRCPYFIIVDIENGKIGKTEIIKNESAEQSSGAGMATAKLVAEKGVTTVITKSVGPRALDVLKQFNIEIIEAEGKINKALEKFIKNN
ncbi:MAG: NifB/NifX family molybdenum-iron cluster-binding protein [Patescibacteria group bacterium]